MHLIESIVQRHQVGNCVQTHLPPESAITSAAVTNAGADTGSVANSRLYDHTKFEL